MKKTHLLQLFNFLLVISFSLNGIAANNVIHGVAIPFNNFSNYPEGSIGAVYNSGPGLAIDQKTITDEDSKMVIMSSTNAKTFTAYVQMLLDKGFTKIAFNRIEDNIFYTLKNCGKLYYLYFTAYSKQVRIIQDNSTRTMLSDLDITKQEAHKTEFYVYSLDYTQGQHATSNTDYWKIDCGSLMIVKLSDNSLFILDSGHERQSSKAALEGLLNFLYKITGQNVGTTLNISGWFFSHAHGDHVYMTYPFITKYHDFLNIKSVLFNFPSYMTLSTGYDIASTMLMKQTFNSYYPDCKYVKLHTGQRFSFQGVKFNVLYTHEDAVDSNGITTITNFNKSSTVLKMTMDNKKFILLADATTQSGNDMLHMYSEATLRSDCVQTAHHGYNDLTSAYTMIAAPLAIFSNSKENVSSTSKTYLGVINAARHVDVLFAYPNTCKLTVENGNIKTEAVPSYRSYITTVVPPDLSENTINSSGVKVDLSFVLTKTSLIDQVIDKTVTGTRELITKNHLKTQQCSLALDGNNSTMYLTDTLPATIAWTMKKPVLLKWYVIHSGSDNALNLGHNPNKWVLCGSNDIKHWTDIDAVNNADLPNNNLTGTAFNISNPKPYLYYVMKIFSTSGANVLQLSEIGLFGEIWHDSVDPISEKL